MSVSSEEQTISFKPSVNMINYATYRIDDIETEMHYRGRGRFVKEKGITKHERICASILETLNDETLDNEKMKEELTIYFLGLLTSKKDKGKIMHYLNYS